MREILFRGKDDHGEWAVGDLAHGCYYSDDVCIRKIITGGHSTTVVEPKTIGQYTGLKDKHGKKIFEGDVIKIHWGEDFCEDCFGKVYFHDYAWCLKETDRNVNPLCDFDQRIVEVIGNIYDNPEFLE